MFGAFVLWCFITARFVCAGTLHRRISTFINSHLIEKESTMDTPKILPTNGNGSGSWDNTVERTKAGAQEAIDKAANTARPVVDKLATGARQAMDRISDKTSQTMSTLSDKADQMKEVQDKVLAQTRLRIREKPVQSLAIAVAVGFVLRQLLKSR
jgi:ElaB/YqjD/DUF883 family membrane-anchored ribosome-binding protein